MVTALRAPISRPLASFELLGCGFGHQQRQAEQLYGMLGACCTFESGIRSGHGWDARRVLQAKSGSGSTSYLRSTATSEE
jgi:hypothetical protein